MEAGTFHAHARVIGAGVEPRESSIRADARGLVIDREEIPRRKIIGAVTELLGADEACRVTIVIRKSWMFFSSISIEVSDREAGLQLAQALGLGSDQGALSVALNHQTTKVDVILLVAGILVGMIGVPALVAISWPRAAMGVGSLFVGASLPLAFVAFELLFRTRVTVGLEGVSRETWRTREHISFDAVEEVTRTVLGASLHLKNGKVIHLFNYVSRNQNETVGELLYRRIWQGHFAHSELCKKRSTIDDVHVLGARSWVRTLREDPDERATSYRAAARTLPQLEDAVFDATQPLQVRVAAAIALRAKEGTSAEKRIRAAASASASPKLRVLFERIAEEATDEELARHIEELTVDPI